MAISLSGSLMSMKGARQPVLICHRHIRMSAQHTEGQNLIYEHHHNVDGKDFCSHDVTEVLIQ